MRELFWNTNATTHNDNSELLPTFTSDIVEKCDSNLDGKGRGEKAATPITADNLFIYVRWEAKVVCHCHNFHIHTYCPLSYTSNIIRDSG